MIKILKNLDREQNSYFNLKKLEKNELYFLYLEDNNLISYFKIKEEEKNLKIEEFKIKEEFKSEGIESILLENLLYFAKRENYELIISEIRDLEHEFLQLGFTYENKLYKRALRGEITKEKTLINLTLISMLEDISSIVSKLTVGFLYNSYALITDAVHTFADFIISLISYFGLKLSKKPKSIKYPYGYYKIQSIAALIMGIIILSTGINLFTHLTGINKYIHFDFNHIHIGNFSFGESSENLHSQEHLSHESESEHGFLLDIFSNDALKESLLIPLIPFIFFLIKIIMYLAKKHFGRKYNSEIILAAASSDKNCILSHGGITLSILLANYVWTGFDKISSLFISSLIIKEGYNVIKNNIKKLLTKQDIDLKRKIKKLVSQFSELEIKEVIVDSKGKMNIIFLQLNLNENSNFVNLNKKIIELKKYIRSKIDEVDKINIVI